jgi:hypothetical protein
MTREHDFAIYEDPVFCRNCGKRKLDAYAAEGGFVPCVGNFRYRLIDAESDGSLARRLREIKAMEGRA